MRNGEWLEKLTEEMVWDNSEETEAEIALMRTHVRQGARALAEKLREWIVRPNKNQTCLCDANFLAMLAELVGEDK